MTVILSSRADIDLDCHYRVSWQGEDVALHDTALGRIAAARRSFEQLLDSNPEMLIYGVTSGYGQMANVRLSLDQRLENARRAPLGPAATFGKPLPPRVTRGIVLARLANFLDGHAAVTPELALAVASLLKTADLPSVPGQGHGGAGEILALSHLFLDLADGFPLAAKEGIALLNGSPCSAALLADAVHCARSRLALATQVFSLAVEALQAPLDAYDPALEALWGDDYEAAALRSLRAWLDDRTNDGSRRPYQAPVSWRIVPRVLGQAHRALAQAEEVARTSLQSVSDNPVYLPPDGTHPHGRVMSNGGFHDAKIYPCLDRLAAVWADLALLCDRQVSKLLDGRVSLLPDQLRDAEGGYLGCVGFTAAGYAEEARQAARPTLLQGSEGGGFGQNDVAVPSLAAWKKESEAGDCLLAALACLAAIASQAIYVTRRPAPNRLAAFVDEVREMVPPVSAPRALGRQLGQFAEKLTHYVYCMPEVIE